MVNQCHYDQPGLRCTHHLRGDGLSRLASNRCRWARGHLARLVCHRSVLGLLKVDHLEFEPGSERAVLRLQVLGRDRQ